MNQPELLLTREHRLDERFLAIRIAKLEAAAQRLSRRKGRGRG